ncbi:hypothetical protein Rt10032_c08g3588 [Rhodotorula toruloides]|uniref:Uncharacterized protein n=1 Tax=Rhodotorula toruloides TaxID=5286 RepID=A0A511KGS3_RHOTO|nr:hypothetical protein Rt10032_c08g3588 [Rhodotorula toruloides]
MRAPMLGVFKRTGDFRYDYLGGDWESLQVSALADLYRILSTDVDTRSAARIRSDAQLADFHLLFSETPTTKDLHRRSTSIALLDRDYIAKLPPNRPTYDTIIVVPSRKLIIPVQLTVSRDHTLVVTGLKRIEARCGDEMEVMGVKRLFLFVGQEGGAAKQLAATYRAKRGIRDGDNKLIAPKNLMRYELGYAELSIEELVGKFSEVAFRFLLQLWALLADNVSFTY